MFISGAVLAHKKPVRRILFFWREIQKFKTKYGPKSIVKAEKLMSDIK